MSLNEYNLFVLQDYLNNESIIISVPSNNPVIPLDIERDYYNTDNTGSGYSYSIFSGFDPNYVPVDADFDVPTDCQPVGKGDPPPHQFLPHSLHRFRSNKKIHHHKKMNMKPLHEYKKIPNILRKRMKKLRK